MRDRIGQAIAEGVVLETDLGRLQTAVIAGPPAGSAEISSAEEQLGCSLPPGYREILQQWNGLTLFDHPEAYYDVRIHGAAETARETLELRRLYPGTPADLVVVATVVYAGDWIGLRRDGTVVDMHHELDAASWRTIAPDLETWLVRTLDTGYWWLRE